LVAVAVGLTMAGCSTTKNSNPDEQIRNQKLSTSFVSENLKIETDCAWYKLTKTDCKIVAIESTATHPTFGATVNNRSQALGRAKDKAYLQVSEFMKTEITSDRVTTTIAKNLEKARDKVSSGKIAEGEVVEMTDKEASNISVRDNANETIVTTTSKIKVETRSILKGFSVIKQEVVGDQEVAVTIRWDAVNQQTAAQLLKQMGN